MSSSFAIGHDVPGFILQESSGGRGRDLWGAGGQFLNSEFGRRGTGMVPGR